MEVQQLRQYRGGNQTAGDLPRLQAEMRISERDLLPARLRLYGNGQQAETDEVKNTNEKRVSTDLLTDYKGEIFSALNPRTMFPHPPQLTPTS